MMGLIHLSDQNFGSAGSISYFRSNNSFGLAAGGGIDYSLSARFAIRGQADWLHAMYTPAGGGDPGAYYPRHNNVARISTGVVFRF